MKKWILALSLLLAGCREDHNDQIQQQFQQAQAQLAEQSAKTGTAQGVAALLGIGYVVFLLIGAALGAKARRAVEHEADQL